MIMFHCQYFDISSQGQLEFFRLKEISLSNLKKELANFSINLLGLIEKGTYFKFLFDKEGLDRRGVYRTFTVCGSMNVVVCELCGFSRG